MKKVWLRGVPGRGKEVIGLLKEYGGEPSATSHYFAAASIIDKQ